MCGCSCCGMVAMQQQRGRISRATCKREAWQGAASMPCAAQAGRQAGRHPTGAGLPRRTRHRIG